MAHSHTWFATADDMKRVLDWLREAQAEVVGASPFPAELPSDGRELLIVLHFPSIGRLDYWPENIDLSDYPENSARWRQAFMAFKSNAKYNRDEYMDRYHKRSNVESTFSMIKRKFGDAVRSKTDVAMVNEVLCKMLAHNICCLIQEQCELGIETECWPEEMAKAQSAIDVAPVEEFDFDFAELAFV